MGACPDRWGQGRPRGRVADPVGALPAPLGVGGPVEACPALWGRGQIRGGVARPVGAWPAPWSRGRQ